MQIRRFFKISPLKRIRPKALGKYVKEQQKYSEGRQISRKRRRTRDMQAAFILVHACTFPFKCLINAHKMRHLLCRGYVCRPSRQLNGFSIPIEIVPFVASLDARSIDLDR